VPGECTGAEFTRFLDADGEPEAADAAIALDTLSLAFSTPPLPASAAAEDAGSADTGA